MITPSVGSHAGVLSATLPRLCHDALVIEHGAGLYSSVLIRDSGHRVVCIEHNKEWRAWAEWLYGVPAIERSKQALGRLTDASLVFVDGLANERGDLLRWSIEARVPFIIAHDTEDDHRKQYGYTRDMFTAPNYDVTHDGVRPRTTLLTLKP